MSHLKKHWHTYALVIVAVGVGIAIETLTDVGDHLAAKLGGRAA